MSDHLLSSDHRHFEVDLDGDAIRALHDILDNELASYANWLEAAVIRNDLDSEHGARNLARRRKALRERVFKPINRALHEDVLAHE